MGHELTADKIITEKQAKMVLRELEVAKDSAIQSGKQFKYITDYYLIAIGYYTGLRISELAALRWQDINDGFLVVQHGKGDKKRTVNFGLKTQGLFGELMVIEQQVFKRGCEPGDNLFIGQRGTLSRFAIHLRFKFWVRRCGLPAALSFHSLRHGFATRLLDKGIPLSSVRTQLGHSNIATTSLYLHFSEEALDKLRKVL